MVTAPSVKPVIVSVTAMAAGIDAPEMVIIRLEAAGKLHVPARFAMLLMPDVKVGLSADEKNPEGYERVIEPPIFRGVVEVNPSVTGTAVFVAMRSIEAIPNETAET